LARSSKEKRPVLVDLVQTTTADGVRLDGMLQTPTGRPALALDGVCLVHGTGGNFYSSTLFDAVGERFLALGCAVLHVNTRGHDGISNAVTTRGGRRLGAAYEVVDDCRHDLAAWTDWLRDRVGPRLGLVGHSLGAVKCLYALAQTAPPAVGCIIAVSPPRLSYSWFCTTAKAEAFLQTFNLARQHVERGQPDVLLDVKFPLPFAITAAGYVEKYGPDERYNYLRLLPAVKCPTLVTLGSIEVRDNAAFQGAPEALRELSIKQPNLQTVLIEGADHFYSGARPQVVAAIESWLRATQGIR
jgi:alpha-beta hydrolase superfamily lysophospholipase